MDPWSTQPLYPYETQITYDKVIDFSYATSKDVQELAEEMRSREEEGFVEVELFNSAYEDGTLETLLVWKKNLTIEELDNLRKVRWERSQELNKDKRAKEYLEYQRLKKQFEEAVEKIDNLL